MSRNRVILIGIVSVALLLFIMAGVAVHGERSEFLAMMPDEAGMMTDVDWLSSAEVEGRLAGSEGNRLAMTELIARLSDAGIGPADVSGRYEQPFKTIIPQIDPSPVFSVGDHSFELYRDYNVLTSMNGGGIDFHGEVILVGANLLTVDPAMIRDRMVVMEAGRLQPGWVSHVLELGGKGLLCCPDTAVYERDDAFHRRKSIGIAGKTGDDLFVGYLSGAAYKALQASKSEEIESAWSIVPDVTMKVDITFPVVETANILGILEGNPEGGRVLLLSANLDGLGMEPAGQVFGGAVKESAGVAALLEIARVLSEQPDLPYQKVGFAFWNGQHQGLAGSSHYLEHPMFPLEDTLLIHLDALGLASLEGLVLQSDSLTSSMFKDKMIQYARDLGVQVTAAGPMNGITNRFTDKDVPAIALSGTGAGRYPADTVADSAEIVDAEALRNAVEIVLGYISKELYRSPLVDYLTMLEKGILLLLLAGGLFSVLLDQGYRRYPAKLIFGISVENLYYRRPVILIRKIYTSVIPYLLVVALLALLVNIRPTTDVRYVQDELTTNFSLHVTLKQTVFYLRKLFEPGYLSGQTVGNVFEVIRSSSLLSLRLIAASLLVASVFGLLRGIFESYRSKRFNLRSLGSLVVFSVPDVFVVLLGLIAYIFAVRRFPVLSEMTWLKGFLLPVLTLSIIPSVYVSRMTAITVHEELAKDYVRAAKAMGYSRRKIFATELMPAVIFRLIDSLPTLMTMLLSNMIIVEYLFNYNGIGYFLLHLYRRQDIERFVPMAIALGMIYAGFVWGIQGLARWMNPAKRETVR